MSVAFYCLARESFLASGLVTEVNRVDVGNPMLGFCFRPHDTGANAKIIWIFEEFTILLLRSI